MNQVNSPPLTADQATSVADALKQTRQAVADAKARLERESKPAVEVNLGINAWGARMHALDEAYRLVHQHYGGQASLLLDELQKRIIHASGQANQPMQTPAEHLARKMVATYRAARTAWLKT